MRACAIRDLDFRACADQGRRCAARGVRRQAYLPNIADSEVLNEVSQIVLKIDFVFVIGTTLFQFSLKITPDSRFVLLGLISGVLSLLSML